MGNRTYSARANTVVVTGCTVLALMGIGAVGSSGRERAKRAVCLANLKQLTLAWNVYADDNDEKIVNGEAYNGADGMALVSTLGRHARELWWTGDDVHSGYMVGLKLPEDLQRQAIMAGALWPYCADVKLYHCPSGRLGELRNYSIVDSMNGLPRSGTHISYRVGVKVGETVLWIKKRTEIVTPGPAERIVFIDQGRVTPDSYAVQYQNERWWDPPSVRHGAGAPLSFADGHTEYWKWQGQETVEVGTMVNPLHQMTPETPEGFADLYRMQEGVWGRLGYTPSHQ